MPRIEVTAAGLSPATGQIPGSPQLTDAQLQRMRGYGTPHEVTAGEIVYRTGDVSYDLILIDSGQVDIVREATRDHPEEIVARHGAGRFLGELNLLTGQAAYLTGRVSQPGRVHRIDPQTFRRLMAEDPELSNLLLRAFRTRRQMIQQGSAARSIEIIGSERSAAALALRTYAARQELAHQWLDAESAAGVALMKTINVSNLDLPAVLVGDDVITRASPKQLASKLGLSLPNQSGQNFDLVIIGAGPAGLAAAVYGASEGLATVVLDAVAPGGQAAASARIENYLGFPNGLSGTDLTARAAIQALKFGAKIFSPCTVTALDASGEQLRIVLQDATELRARAVAIATGAQYRSLPLARWEEFVGAGIHYAATELETRAIRGEPVTVVGGANSAAQAALFLASRGNDVCLVLRGADITVGMSRYLVDRLLADPRVKIYESSEVTQLQGQTALENIIISNRITGDTREQCCRGLFCFIGADPATSWVKGVATDSHGFVKTDTQLTQADLGEIWSTLGRPPLPFETSVPAVFAAGDVRHGSMKRVAAAVGEGASVVASVHTAIGGRVT